MSRKILFVVGDQKNNPFGGNERHSLRYLDYLKNYGITDITLFEFKDYFKNSSNLSGFLNNYINGIHLFFISLFFDVIFCNQPHYASVPIFLSSFKKLIIRCGVDNPANGILFSKYKTRYLRNVYWIIPRPYDLEFMRRKILIPNLVTSINLNVVNEQNKSIICIGNFTQGYKGAETIKYLSEIGIGVSVLGNWPHKIADNLKIYGNKDFQPFSFKHGIFLLTSHSEGVSNALLETMLFGYIPVVRDISANNFIIKHGINGFIFRNDEDCAFLLQEIISSDDFYLEIRQNARSTALKYLDYSNFNSLVKFLNYGSGW